jgi:hypothetical protein
VRVRRPEVKHRLYEAQPVSNRDIMLRCRKKLGQCCTPITKEAFEYSVIDRMMRVELRHDVRQEQVKRVSLTELVRQGA